MFCWISIIRRATSLMGATVVAARTAKQVLWSRVQDSNLLLLFTRQLLFPMSYRGTCGSSRIRTGVPALRARDPDRWTMEPGVTGGIRTHKDRGHNPARLLFRHGHSSGHGSRTRIARL